MGFLNCRRVAALNDEHRVALRTRFAASPAQEANDKRPFLPSDESGTDDVLAPSAG